MEQMSDRARVGFVSLCPSTRVAPERRAGKLLERLDGRACDACEGRQDVDTPSVEDLLDHFEDPL